MTTLLSLLIAREYLKLVQVLKLSLPCDAVRRDMGRSTYTLVPDGMSSYYSSAHKTIEATGIFKVTDPIGLVGVTHDNHVWVSGTGMLMLDDPERIVDVTIRIEPNVHHRSKKGRLYLLYASGKVVEYRSNFVGDPRPHKAQVHAGPYYALCQKDTFNAYALSAVSGKMELI